MRVLVTGGTGVVGQGAVTELIARGHTVALLSRHAEDAARQWPHGVEPRPGDVSRPETLEGAAAGCDAVLHIVGTVEEDPPAVTFERVNVDGTRHILEEARRAGAARFVFVSSLGAPTGTSAYHRSKQRAEELVRTFEGNWTICRPGNVYGPGDDEISLLLRLVRGPSPVVPTIGSGDEEFQPIWWEDLARALAQVVERADLAGRSLELAGTERTSQNDLLRRLARLTGRDVRGVPVPDAIASWGARVVSLVGWNLSFTEDQIRMLHEGNVLAPGVENALVTVLGVTPTPLESGLEQLCSAQPEQLPSAGTGALCRKRCWADIAESGLGAEEMCEFLRTHFHDITPVFVDGSAEAGEPAELRRGATLTLALPLRGHVQVRVAGETPRSVTLVTLEGHPLAGAVRFTTEPRGRSVRFAVEVFTRPATVLDQLAMRVVGDLLQNRTWTEVVERTVERSGGCAIDGVHAEERTLDDEEAERIQEWLEELVRSERRARNAERIAQGARGAEEPSARSASSHNTCEGRA